MQYLKKIARRNKVFTAYFTNGETTSSYEAASFFMVLQDKEIGAASLDSYIKLGQKVDPMKPWAEIKRIAKTFTGAENNGKPKKTELQY